MTSESRRKIFVDTLFLLRKFKVAYPHGHKDNGGRWYPSEEDEACSCCRSLRQPSRAYPFSLWQHCRTRKHVQTLYDEKSFLLPPAYMEMVENPGTTVLHLADKDPMKDFAVYLLKIGLGE